MKRTSLQDKLARKRQALVERTALALGVGLDDARELLLTGRQQSVRLNRLSADPAETLAALRKLGWQGSAYSWSADCYSIDDGAEALRDCELVEQGAAFIQNAASWLPVLALDPRPGERILDVCAAPGGKTTHIAALTDNRADITANDNSRARLMKLQSTCQRLNASVSRFTLYDATALARKLDGEAFDRILLDAPCSGEGLMRLDRDKDFATWSVAHIKRLQRLQKKVLVQAWRLLKPGGTLVYSTCTMAPEEDEMVIDYGLRALEDVRLVPLDIGLSNRVPAVAEWNGKRLDPVLGGCIRLRPSRDIEAFFVAKLQKG